MSSSHVNIPDEGCVDCGNLSYSTIHVYTRNNYVSEAFLYSPALYDFSGVGVILYPQP